MTTSHLATRATRTVPSAIAHVTRLTRLAATLALTASLAQPMSAPAHAAPVTYQSCREFMVTGYVKGADSPWTADHTSIWTEEPIAAAQNWVPFNAYVWIDGLGSYRIADRGGLAAAGVDFDLSVWTYREAYALTGYHFGCLAW
jgi:3D (Asp-Asp-Asp) domain-containing protein